MSTIRGQGSSEEAARDDPDFTVSCARHPKISTTLRCGRCETPICPRCLVATPVGVRCPACAQVKRVSLIIKPLDLARAAGLGLATALVGTVILGYLERIPGLGALLLFGLAGLGYAVGEAVAVAVNRRRARELGFVAIACLVIGYALGPLLALILGGRLALLPLLPALLLQNLLGMLFNIMLLIGLGVGALLAWMRVR